ncbi:uncharacterized protein LTR77_001710 [Saxophila tyrrhenica]|uniref:Enoyl reductase (ER) domain-containing protein n=1 Tax=Saxophila tyrrhenica TaxID=1690608 RepID=A0AAV9PMA4_9PEZI|nr:hypothetical protein LTR77_001710 [Saxophila tyrrhenica]
MTEESLPSTMRIWKYASAKGGIEKHLSLHTSHSLPTPKLDKHLVQVLAVGLNPVDYKPAEAFIGTLAVKKPATPGFDFAGRIITAASGSTLKPGQLVFGAASTNAVAAGGLAEYIAAPDKIIAAIPSGLSPLTAAGVPVAAVTAYGSLVSHVKTGSRVFLNGGSGGVGTYGIQIAKVLGAHVTVSCSGRNADLCRSLGADEVLDYTARPLLEQLQQAAKTSGPFDHVVDNVFSDPALYYQAHTYTTPTTHFMEVASAPSLAFLRFAFGAQMLPGFLGGGRRKFVVFLSDVNRENIEKIGSWIAEGKVKPVTDQVFPMTEAVEAFKRLKTGRVVGKVIIDVAEEGK